MSEKWLEYSNEKDFQRKGGSIRKGEQIAKDNGAVLHGAVCQLCGCKQGTKANLEPFIVADNRLLCPTCLTSAPRCVICNDRFHAKSHNAWTCSWPCRFEHRRRTNYERISNYRSAAKTLQNKLNDLQNEMDKLTTFEFNETEGD